MSAVEVTELQRFMNMVVGLELRHFDEGVMVTAPSSVKESLMIARRESGCWMVSVVKIEEVPAWPGPE